MQLIYTPYSAREKVRTDDAYISWLQSIKEDDHVLVQGFHPPNDPVSGFPFERWSFEWARVGKDGLFTSDRTLYFDPATGKRKYGNSSLDWVNVFPFRIVPTSDDIPVQELGSSVFGHLPAYEPLWLYASKIVFLLKRGGGDDRLDRQRHHLKRQFPCHYEVKADQGVLFSCFYQGEETDWQEWAAEQGLTQVQYLYSQFCQY